MNVSLWKQIPLTLLFLFGMTCMSLAQEEGPSRASISVVATNLKIQESLLDGKTPIGAYEIHNHGKEWAGIAGGGVTIGIDSIKKGVFWVQTDSGKMRPLSSNHIVFNGRDTYSFALPTYIPPGEKITLYIFLKCDGVAPTTYPRTTTLQAIYRMSKASYLAIQGGTVKVDQNPKDLEYNFEIRPKKVAKEQKSRSIVASAFTFDNKHKQQTLMNINFRLNTPKDTQGKAELWVGGKMLRSISIQEELKFNKLKLLMVKGVHEIGLVLKTNPKTGEKLQATLTHVETTDGVLPADMAFPNITIK